MLCGSLFCELYNNATIRKFKLLNEIIKFIFLRCITLFKENWKLGHFKIEFCNTDIGTNC